MKVLSAVYRLLRAALIGSIVFVLTGCRYWRWESEDANPGHADVVIVPGMQLAEDGSAGFILHNRVAMAKYLLDQGMADKMLVTGGKPRGGITEAERMARIARRLGVPQERIIAEPNARSSLENARFSADLMVSAGYRSALVVSDRQHLGYAIPVFRDAFEARDLVLYWIPVDYRLLDSLKTVRHPDDPPLPDP